MRTAESLTVRGFQELVDRWIRSTGKGYFSPLTNMAILSEETGEVARIMARIYGDQTPKAGDKATLADLGEELADVVRVVVAIASQTGIDLAAELLAKAERIERRDAGRHKAE